MTYCLPIRNLTLYNAISLSLNNEIRDYLFDSTFLSLFKKIYLKCHLHSTVRLLFMTAQTKQQLQQQPWHERDFMMGAICLYTTKWTFSKRGYSIFLQEGCTTTFCFLNPQKKRKNTFNCSVVCFSIFPLPVSHTITDPFHHILRHCSVRGFPWKKQLTFMGLYLRFFHCRRFCNRHTHTWNNKYNHSPICHTLGLDLDQT